MAILAGKSKSFLAGRFYINTMRIVGSALCILGVILIRDGLRLLGVSI